MKSKDDNQVKDEHMLGDVLGIGAIPAEPKLPHPPSDGSTPEGIDPVEQQRNRNRSQADTKGATGIDMGGAGSGTDIDPSA